MNEKQIKDKIKKLQKEIDKLESQLSEETSIRGDPIVRFK